MSDTFFYFAYGSNMLTERLTARCPSATAMGMAEAKNRRLAFVQKGGDGSAKATLVRAAGNTAYGTLFEIDLDERAALDRAEDAPVSYSRDDSFPIVFKDIVKKVTTYIGRIPVDPHILPFDWYRALCLAGVRQHDLPQTLIDALAAQPCAIDPDPTSAGRKKAVEALKKAGYDETAAPVYGSAI